MRWKYFGKRWWLGGWKSIEGEVMEITFGEERRRTTSHAFFEGQLLEDSKGELQDISSELGREQKEEIREKVCLVGEKNFQGESGRIQWMKKATSYSHSMSNCMAKFGDFFKTITWLNLWSCLC